MNSFEMNLNTSDDSFIKVEENRRDTRTKSNSQNLSKNRSRFHSREKYSSPNGNYGVLRQKSSTQEYYPKKFPLLSTSEKSPKEHQNFYERAQVGQRHGSKTELKKNLNSLLSTVKSNSLDSNFENFQDSSYIKRKKFERGNLRSLALETSVSQENDENEISKFHMNDLYPMTNVMTSRERTYYREEIQKMACKLRERALLNDRLNSVNNEVMEKLRIQKSRFKELENRNGKICEELNQVKIENQRVREGFNGNEDENHKLRKELNDCKNENFRLRNIVEKLFNLTSKLEKENKNVKETIKNFKNKEKIITKKKFN